MPKIERPGTLTSEVVAYIREAVIRGEFEPERPLPEVRLAQELETARVTVRVALRALADLGLVEIIPHRGAFVSALTSRNAWEIFSLRAVLESYAARLALEGGPLPDEALEELETLLGRIAETAEDTDTMDLIEAVMDSLQEAGALRNGRLRDSHSRMGLDLVIGTLVRAGGDYPIEDVRVELHHAVDLFLDGALKPGA